jgi:hypothetical protein
VEVAVITDPIERIIADALDSVGIVYSHESDRPGSIPLDFYLPAYDLWIECKAYHAERIAGQMAKARDVIAIQGIGAARAFAAMIRGGSPCE